MHGKKGLSILDIQKLNNGYIQVVTRVGIVEELNM